MEAIVGLVGALVTTLGTIVQRAMAAKDEERAAIIARLQAALDGLRVAETQLPEALAQNDAKYDAQLADAAKK